MRQNRSSFRLATSISASEMLASDSASARWATSLLPRTWKVVGAGEPKAKPIRVMQFNTLAQGLSADPADTPPFAFESVSNKGGFDDECVVPFSERKWGVLEEIKRYLPDVLALEEVRQRRRCTCEALSPRRHRHVKTSSVYRQCDAPRAGACQSIAARSLCVARE